MDALKPSLPGNDDRPRPTREQALDAVRTLIAWAGDDPDRPGVIDTPGRVLDAYGDWFSGYREDAARELSKVFDDVTGYDDMVLVRDIEVESHCEHHLAPFIGKATVAYIPDQKVVGLSKLARVVEIFSRRLQSQETLTNQIVVALEDSVQPLGVAVLIDAEHQCMTTRGVNHRHASTVTTRFTGRFRDDPALTARFMQLSQAR